MGVSIALHYGSWEVLVSKFVERGCPKNWTMRAMELLGIHAGNQYIILYNEKYEDCNPAIVLSAILDRSLPDYKEDEYRDNDTFEILLNNTKTFHYLDLEEALKKLKKKSIQKRRR